MKVAGDANSDHKTREMVQGRRAALPGLGHTMGRESTAHDPLSGIEEQDVFDDLTPYVSKLNRE